MLLDYGFTPSSLRQYLLAYVGDNLGTITYSNGVTDVAVTVGNISTNNVELQGIELHLPLFPDTEELSMIDQDTASYINFWELGLYAWDEKEETQLKLYEILSVLTRCLSGVKVYRCSAGLSNGFPYAECYTVLFKQSCTGYKETVNSI